MSTPENNKEEMKEQQSYLSKQESDQNISVQKSSIQLSDNVPSEQSVDGSTNIKDQGILYGDPPLRFKSDINLYGPSNVIIKYVDEDKLVDVNQSLVESYIVDHDYKDPELKKIDASDSNPICILKDRRLIVWQRASAIPKYNEQLYIQEHQNGFQPPFTINQKLSWIVYVINLCFQITIVWKHNQEKHEIANSLIFILAFVIVNVMVLYYQYYATIMDPSDHTPRLERYSKITNQQFEEHKYEFYCQYCDAHVLEKTKHCSRCNRCTADFDHHCVWLNNCIGGHNYTMFFKLIIWVTLYSADIIVISAIVSSQIKEKYILALCIVEIVINVPVFGFTANLVKYHIWLKYKGISTYQDILNQRSKAAQELHKKKEMTTDQGKQKNKMKKIKNENNDIKVEKQEQREILLNLDNLKYNNLITPPSKDEENQYNQIKALRKMSLDDQNQFQEKLIFSNDGIDSEKSNLHEKLQMLAQSTNSGKRKVTIYSKKGENSSQQMIQSDTSEDPKFSVMISTNLENIKDILEPSQKFDLFFSMNRYSAAKTMPNQKEFAPDRESSIQSKSQNFYLTSFHKKEADPEIYDLVSKSLQKSDWVNQLPFDTSLKQSIVEEQISEDIKNKTIDNENPMTDI